MLTISINLYSFGELSKESQTRAISEHADFLRSIEGKDYADEDVVAVIEVNEYLFFNDGEMAHCTVYTGQHPKSGITEFKFHGEVIELVNT